LYHKAVSLGTPFDDEEPDRLLGLKSFQRVNEQVNALVLKKSPHVEQLRRLVRGGGAGAADAVRVDRVLDHADGNGVTDLRAPSICRARRNRQDLVR